MDLADGSRPVVELTLTDDERAGEAASRSWALAASAGRMPGEASDNQWNANRRVSADADAAAALAEFSRVSEHLMRMARRGLVERTTCDTDGRGTVVVLTDEGRDRLAGAAPVHAEWVHRAFFADPEHEDALADILAVVHESLLREGTLPRPDLK